MKLLPLITSVFVALSLLGCSDVEKGGIGDFTGCWRGDLYPETAFELRPDGTYRTVGFEVLAADQHDLWHLSEGTWRAMGRDRFALKQSLSVKLAKEDNGTKRIARGSGQEVVHRVRWIDGSSWQPEVAMGSIRRCKLEEIASLFEFKHSPRIDRFHTPRDPGSTSR